MTLGRPITYTDEIGERICTAVAITPRGLDYICQQNPDFPIPNTIYEWRFKIPAFGERYRAAKTAQAELMAEKIDALGEIARSAAYVDEKGITRIDAGIMASYKMDSDNHKWTAARLLPHLYGEKVTPPEDKKSALHIHAGDVPRGTE